MRKAISLFLATLLFCNSAFSNCDFSKIIKNEDGTYTYSKELHICVGELKVDNEVKSEQISEYKKAIELKDLAILKAQERADLWMDTSYTLENKLQKAYTIKNRNYIVYYGLGILTMSVAVWGAGQLR